MIKCIKNQLFEQYQNLLDILYTFFWKLTVCMNVKLSVKKKDKKKEEKKEMQKERQKEKNKIIL